mgnify:FL=1
MEMLVETVKVPDEGFKALMGQRITLFCMNYIYTGRLIGVNTTCVKLTDASIVYETGSFQDKSWKDAQKLPNDLYVQNNSIESFCVLK